ncbi:zf-HC2 domain-containing protein [Lysinibacillus sp. G4S2]|uniref:zf-HC2 domain-containing protein n=1 Tax=Lysinibacillus sp. G4S2 TaxID=3055859 RepID=UPI0025A1B6BD|nr:zf-HC2 domain-containing protein [Lysinibacillus sp. G4S2]MDM5250991.1 zf-HC2 domain-containing protein [Lysinibacillus sp. G4S2]
MKEIKCTIIQDILPLYVDGVVSEDTKDMVNKHLQTCPACQKEYEQMTQTLYVPVENKVTLFNKINKRWYRKKIILISTSVLTTALLLLAVFSYVFHYEKTIPYEKKLFSVEQQEDGTLATYYYGKSYAGVVASHPMSIEIDGVTKNVSFVYFTETIADSPRRNLINGEKQTEAYQISLPDSRSVDAVYYGEFDLEKIVITKEQTWEELLQGKTLIWKK